MAAGSTELYLTSEEYDRLKQENNAAILRLASRWKRDGDRQEKMYDAKEMTLEEKLEHVCNEVSGMIKSIKDFKYLIGWICVMVFVLLIVVKIVHWLFGN